MLNNTPFDTEEESLSFNEIPSPLNTDYTEDYSTDWDNPLNELPEHVSSVFKKAKSVSVPLTVPYDTRNAIPVQKNVPPVSPPLAKKDINESFKNIQAALGGLIKGYKDGSLVELPTLQEEYEKYLKTVPKRKVQKQDGPGNPADTDALSDGRDAQGMVDSGVVDSIATIGAGAVVFGKMMSNAMFSTNAAKIAHAALTGQTIDPNTATLAEVIASVEGYVESSTNVYGEHVSAIDAAAAIDAAEEEHGQGTSSGFAGAPTGGTSATTGLTIGSSNPRGDPDEDAELAAQQALEGPQETGQGSADAIGGSVDSALGPVGEQSDDTGPAGTVSSGIEGGHGTGGGMGDTSGIGSVAGTGTGTDMGASDVQGGDIGMQGGESAGGGGDGGDSGEEGGIGIAKGGQIKGHQEGDLVEGQADTTMDTAGLGPMGLVDDMAGDKVTGVEDDLNLETEEGAYVLNADAVELVGLKDLNKLTKDAIEIAIESDIPIPKTVDPTKKVPIKISNGEYVIPAILVPIIGLENLEKMNKRGLAYREKNREEEAPPQEAQQQAVETEQAPAQGVPGEINLAKGGSLAEQMNRLK